MRIKKKYRVLVVLLVFAFAFIWGGIEINKKIEWKITENIIAGGAFPYEIGCMSSVVIPCFTTGEPPVCVGGTLCPALDIGRCVLYSDVNGAPTGPSPCNVLFMKSSLSLAGLSPGADFIAAGNGPTLMDSGPLASWGGCVNCLGRGESAWKQKLAAAKDMIMAVFKD